MRTKEEIKKRLLTLIDCRELLWESGKIINTIPISYMITELKWVLNEQDDKVH